MDREIHNGGDVLCSNVYFDNFDFCTIFSPYLFESRFLVHRNQSKLLIFFVGTLKTPYVALIDGVTMGGVRYWINICSKSLSGLKGRLKLRLH